MRVSRWMTGAGVLVLLGSAPVLPRVDAEQQEQRVLLFYDMEGATGIDDGDQFDSRLPEKFAVGRQFLVDDVNAVIDGLFQGGATAVDVFNTHGAGGDTLVSRAQLDPRAQIISRRGPRVAYDPSATALTARYAAAVSIAAHDKPLSGGFSPHTMTIGTTPVVNGVGLTETDLLAYAVGTRGVPMIMASGDDVLGRSLQRTLPGIEYVAVKRSTPRSVTLEPAAQARANLRAAAARAMSRHRTNPMQPLRPGAPIRAGLLPSYPAWLYPTMDQLPGITRSGDTVTFIAPDYPAAYRGMILLLNMAASVREALVLDELNKQGMGRDALRAASDSVTRRWVAFERGEWKPQ